MQQKEFFVGFILILTSLLINIIQPSVVTNLCPDTSSCNCTLTNSTDLDIVCISTPFLTELPILTDETLQTSVTQLRVSSATADTHGPLITLPTNMCSSYPNIATLDLSSNTITGLLNTSELACLGSNLIDINFSNNYINETDLNFFQATDRLQSINLSQNNLTTMPTINAKTFVNFPSTIILMNFSYNQIINVDLWPLFVKTQKYMAIDMSNNLIRNYTNQVPIYVQQFSETPDPRNFYLNNNQLERLSDILLEQYGACSTISSISTSYFLVGISNILLTNNPLICDCESYYLVTFINDHISDFPEINNGSALLTQATCTLPDLAREQKYIFSNLTTSDSCKNYTLPNRTDIFCSVYTNETSLTLSPPTYWPSSTTVLTTIIQGNKTTTDSSGNGGTNTNGSSNSTSPSWYIILGIVLGLALILFLIVLGGYLYKDRLFPQKYHSKLSDSSNNPNNPYETIIRNSQASSQTTLPLNGLKPRRASMSTSTCGVDDQDNGMLQLEEHGSMNAWSDKINPEQETQTCFQIVRTKPPSGVTRNPQNIRQNNSLQSSHRERKLLSSTSTDVATNTTNVVKGIPIPSTSSKISSISSNVNHTMSNTSTSELSMTSIPLTPSKRAKLLPQVKSGNYVDSINNNLLNTSASALITKQRQRRRSSMWLRKQNQNTITPLPVRPQSMITQKSIFDQDDSTNEEVASIPTMESLSSKPSKPLRALPLLNITVVPASADDNTDQK
ncbi:unnamed protein product [Rotaria sp. Silwood1]|nr:unnamed protein product [Rotaria sp. Silwood1]CAF0934219.1 unnamed protein product [Rotaria sp. Silwood1]CAF4578943.1 unnamed protein product [Rotaria sp. Silwood1]CAF4763876.1 unnamed protein product [Rotaria sp. Silwood1]